mmetsp:Transcript_28503/g.73378  ORF Transcript_28503/g.73378 Transcript_28503/m.73378 type:complete len:137 (-) Transcript_28503:359-769(-)
MHSMNQHVRSEGTIPSLDATLDAFRCLRSRILTRLTHTHSIERAKSLASTTEVCKKSTEARAQRDAEVPGGPEITARAQRSTEREPWADQQKEPIDERCTNHGPNEHLLVGKSCDVSGKKDSVSLPCGRRTRYPAR